jgi:micrococcal nuclease
MYEYKVSKIARVVDGDTLDVIIDLGFGLFKKERVRVAGIDTPECRTRDLVEKKYGLEAKEFMKQLLKQSKNLIIRTEKDGKYGRCLGWIYTEGNHMSLNEQMIEMGYAFPYDGGTKLTGDARWTALDAKRINNNKD